VEKGIWYIICFMMVCISTAYASDRAILKKPHTKRLKITFNGETISAYYCVLDARTSGQKALDKERGSPEGDVFVFFQGHAQRPTDLYKFTSMLAMKSLSGIVIVPVCDTPYGDDIKWCGDRAKDVMLMEAVRYILHGMGIVIDGYRPITGMDVFVDGTDMKGLLPGKDDIHTKLIALGWSHGGILARRFAHAYPGAVTSLAQMCPAGYEHWGTARLLLRFNWECLRISALVFRGHAKDVLGAGFGITRGIVGDFLRSIPSAFVHLQPSKLLRAGRDIKECTLYLDDSNADLPGIENVLVIFGADDTCMDVRKQARIKDVNAPKDEEIKAFWKKFYPEELSRGAGLCLRILPGTHLGPGTHTELYLDAVLDGVDKPGV